MGPKSAQIVIRRPEGGYRDKFRRYRIEVDGVVKARLKRGDRVSIAVTSGRHRVRARIDWTGSPEIEVSSDDGSVTQMIIEPAGAGSITGFHQVATKSGYLRLSVVDASE